MNNNSEILRILTHAISTETAALQTSRWKGGMFCRHFPSELLAGLGIHPFRIISDIGPTAEREGERMVRPDVCPYCKCILGNLALGNGLVAAADLLVGPVTCDMMRRTIDRIQTDFQVPVFPVHVPATRTVHARDYYHSQVKTAIEEIASFTGTRFDPEECRNYLAHKQNCAKKLYAISITGRVSRKILFPLMHLFHFAAPDRFEDLLDTILPLLPEECRDQPKIILTGSSLCFEDDGVPEFLENAGLSVINLTCGGINALAQYLQPMEIPDIDADWIRICSDNVFDSPPCIRSRPNLAVYERMQQMIRQTGAVGAVLKTLKFCDLWFTEKERMREQLGVPLLVLDTDYSESRNESQRNRVDAFAEILRDPENREDPR